MTALFTAEQLKHGSCVICTAWLLPCLQVNSLQTANASLRESLKQTKQQLEGGELHKQLELVSLFPATSVVQMVPWSQLSHIHTAFLVTVTWLLACMGHCG